MDPPATARAAPRGVAAGGQDRKTGSRETKEERCFIVYCYYYSGAGDGLGVGGRFH